MLKVVFYSNSIDNPLIDAWLDFLALVHIDFVYVAEIEDSDLAKVPIRFRNRLVVKDVLNFWKFEAEQILGGSPDVVIYWWGLHSLQRHDVYRFWSKSRFALIVDTFPNASRRVTELREIVKAKKLLLEVDTLIVSTYEMKRSLEQIFSSSIKNANLCVVPSPFGLRNHFGSSDHENFSHNDSLNLVFLGRTDFLFTNHKKMLKDDLGSLFSNLVKEGATLTLRETGNPQFDRFLIDKGFSLYHSLDRNCMSNGEFSKFISRFSAQIPVYNAHNRTIKNRVSNGLSTRFLQGICSDSPLIIQNESSSGVNFIQDFGTGVAINSDLNETLRMIEFNQRQFRANWKFHHHLWAAETFVERFVDSLQKKSHQ